MTTKPNSFLGQLRNPNLFVIIFRHFVSHARTDSCKNRLILWYKICCPWSKARGVKPRRVIIAVFSGRHVPLFFATEAQELHRCSYTRHITIMACGWRNSCEVDCRVPGASHFIWTKENFENGYADFFHASLFFIYGKFFCGGIQISPETYSVSRIKRRSNRDLVHRA